MYRRNHSSHETHETRENTEVSCFFSLARLQNFSFLINFSLNKKPLGRLDLFSNFLIMAVPLFVCCVVLTKFNLAFSCLGETFSLTWPNAQDFVGNWKDLGESVLRTETITIFGKLIFNKIYAQFQLDTSMATLFVTQSINCDGTLFLTFLIVSWILLHVKGSCRNFEAVRFTIGDYAKDFSIKPRHFALNGIPSSHKIVELGRKNCVWRQFR